MKLCSFSIANVWKNEKKNRRQSWKIKENTMWIFIARCSGCMGTCVGALGGWHQFGWDVTGRMGLESQKLTWIFVSFERHNWMPTLCWLSYVVSRISCVACRSNDNVKKSKEKREWKIGSGWWVGDGVQKRESASGPYLIFFLHIFCLLIRLGMVECFSAPFVHI